MVKYVLNAVSMHRTLTIDKTARRCPSLGDWIEDELPCINWGKAGSMSDATNPF
jgi:hypothetical protein